ncbi:hypothetical protein GE107_17320 [Cohnella sp. CFH 77786]|uniref:hypothetical protein n=1 Tax=Cohnella sp. CFH 77786 TaxID=2662265 RepID=UPI001C60E95F|nr:hypothetical protein [Cohnella sp. CFH 77786]MBW5447818.1 hypothetical protein [Cohnella sp. CFH 77786]
MLTVRQASFRGIRDSGGRRLAEVEVRTGPGNQALLAYFREGPKGYQLVRVLANDADTETDWFDNAQHEAFRDVTMQWFHGPSHAGGDDRNAFAEQVLDTGGVRADLDLHFGRGGR